MSLPLGEEPLLRRAADLVPDDGAGQGNVSAVGEPSND